MSGGVEELASAVCDALGSGKLKTTPSFIRKDREAKIVKVFQAAKLDKAALETMNGRAVEDNVRKVTESEAWIDDVICALKAMLRPEPADVTVPRRQLAADNMAAHIAAEAEKKTVRPAHSGRTATPLTAEESSAPNRPGERMSLLDDDTYYRPDAELLPLITPAAARERDASGHTPLHEAAWYSSSVAVVQAILKAYPEAAMAKTDRYVTRGQLPLHLAARNSSSVAVVQALLAANPKAAMATDDVGSTPLHNAARKSSSVAVVQALLAAYPEAAKATNKKGETPAYLAANHNDDAEVKAFFASGQHLQATPGQSAGERMSLLDDDTYYRPDAELLPLITPAAARERDASGHTPLHEAAWYSSSVAVVQAILKAYPEAAMAKTDRYVTRGQLPLHLAARNSSSVAVVQALLAANPKAAMATDDVGSTPLHNAARKSSSVAVVQALLAAYPEAAKATNKKGETPAYLAANHNDDAEVKAFFASGQHLQATPGQSAAAAEKAEAAKAPAAPAAHEAGIYYGVLAADIAADNMAAHIATEAEKETAEAAAADTAAGKAAAAKAQQEADDAQLAAAFAASLAVSVPVPPPPQAAPRH
jgi:ankyrin repeat protein